MSARTTSSPWDGWDGDLAALPCLVINLKRSTERWAAVEQHVKPLLPRLRRFDAVDAGAQKEALLRDPRVSVGTRHRLTSNSPRWTEHEIDRIGAIGCSLSHIKVWEHIVSKRIPLMLVLEDQCQLTANHVARVRQVYQGADTPLQHNGLWFLNAQFDISEPLGASRTWHTPTTHTGTYAYIITHDAAAALLKEAFPIEMHVDWFMTRMGRLNLVQTAIQRSITIPFMLGSTIGHGLSMQSMAQITITLLCLIAFVFLVLWVAKCLGKSACDKRLRACTSSCVH